MSVQKFNSKTKVFNQPIPYTQINSNVIQNITDMEAGFVWVYLQSKSMNWNVIKTHIKTHFKVGDKKIKTIFAYLNRHNLIRYHQIRTEDGKKISHHDIEVLNGEDFIINPVVKELSTEEVSTGSIINPVRTYPYRKEGTTKERNTNIKEKEKIKRERARKKRVPFPPDFYPSERRLILAHETEQRTGTSKEVIIQKFKNVMLSKDKLSADWDSEFENFCLSERPRTQELKKTDYFLSQREENQPRSAVNRMQEYVSPRNIRSPHDESQGREALSCDRDAVSIYVTQLQMGRRNKEGHGKIA